MNKEELLAQVAKAEANGFVLQDWFMRAYGQEIFRKYKTHEARIDMILEKNRFENLINDVNFKAALEEKVAE